MGLISGILERLRGLLGQGRGLFNLEVAPTYVIKASRTNPYFQALERRAREAAFLGTFVVDHDGRLREGSREGLTTLHATLALDVYPNPAAVEGRTVGDYDDRSAPRRSPRATLVLEDESELFLWLDGRHLRVSGEALTRAQEARGPA